MAASLPSGVTSKPLVTATTGFTDFSEKVKQTEHGKKRKAGGQGKKGKIFLENKVGTRSPLSETYTDQAFILGRITELDIIRHRFEGRHHPISSSET